MFSLVIPVYNNENNIPLLLEAVDYLADEIDEKFEVVFVVDGSPDNSYIVLREQLPRAAFSSQLIALSRNFGAFAAIRAGMEKARGDRLAVMAADLQEQPKLVLDMQRTLVADEFDVVYGERTGRKDGRLSELLSRFFWGIYRRIVSADIPRGGVDIFGCTSQVRDQILKLSERNSSLIGLLFWVGFRRKAIPYQRQKREIGTSAWTFLKKWKYMQDSIFSFSDIPITLLIGVGVTGSILSTLAGLFVLTGALLGLITVPGYAAIMLAILFFGTLQILSIGVLGIYLWRVFENTKGRPLHIVMSALDFSSEDLEGMEMGPIDE